MAVDFDKAFETLANTDYWVDVALVFGGYMGAATLDAVLRRFANHELVGIGAGVGVGAAGAAMGQMNVAYGGAAYSAMEGARLVGVRDMVLSTAAGGA